MTGAELLAQIEAVQRNAARHPEVATVSAVRRTAPLSPAELEVVEARLGVRLPELLRDFDLHAAGSVELDFDAKDEAWEKAGLGEPWGGRIGIADGRTLGLRPWVPGLVQVTSDSHHDGWHLDLRTRREPLPLVWVDHDRLDRPHEPELASFDELVAALVPRVFHDRAPPAVEALLARGELTALRPRRAAPARAHPAWALEHDADRLRLVASFEGEVLTSLVPLGAERAAVGGVRRVIVVERAGGAALHTFTLGRPTWALAAAAEALVAGGEYGLAFLDVATGDSDVRPAGNVTAVALAPDGQTCAIGTRKGKVELWSRAERRRSAELAGHAGIVHAVAFDGARRVVSSGGDGKLRVFDPDGRARHVLDHDPLLARLAPEGPRLLVREGRAYLVAGQLALAGFDTASGERVFGPGDDLPALAPTAAVCFAPDGGTVFAGRAGARIEAWDAAGNWRWSYCANDGAVPVALACTGADRVLFASHTGYLAELRVAPVAADCLAALEVARALERHGSLAAVAQASGSEASALEARLRALEAAIGDALFERPQGATPRRKDAARGTRRGDPGQAPMTLTARGVAILCGFE